MVSNTLKSESFRKKGRKRPPLKGGSEIGDLLSTLRTEQGWTRAEAGSETGISHRIIEKLEKGKLDTSISNLEKYLNLFGFTLTTKRIGTPDPTPTQHSITLDDKGLPKW